MKVPIHWWVTCIWLWIKCNIEYANSIFWCQAILIFSSFLITFIVCVCIPGMNQERGLVTLNVQYYTLQSSNSRHLIGQRRFLQAARVHHRMFSEYFLFQMNCLLKKEKKKERKSPTTIEKCKRENHLCCKLSAPRTAFTFDRFWLFFYFCVPSECSCFMRIADVVGTAVLFPL